MKAFTCPVCESHTHDTTMAYLSKTPIFENKQIYLCAQCKTGSVNPMVNNAELSSYYKCYWKQHELRGLMTLFKKQARARYLFLKPYLQNANVSRILDVGAGFGMIRREFPDSIAYEAIEVDPHAVRFLNESIRASAVRAHVDDCKGPYELIILSHIIEHMPHPVQYLIDQTAMLGKKGILYIEVPNMDYRYKLLNEPHLAYFNPISLKYLADKVGLKVLAIATCGQELHRLERLSKQPKDKNSTRNREIVKKVLPPFFLQFARNVIEIGKLNECFKYGPDRQWIRLIASK